MIFAACHDAIVKYNIDPPPLFAKSEVDKNVLVYYHQDRTVRKNVLTEKNLQKFHVKVEQKEKEAGKVLLEALVETPKLADFLLYNDKSNILLYI